MWKKLMILVWIVLVSFMDIAVQAGGRYFTAYKATTAPLIDGNGNDSCWDKAQWYPINVLWQGLQVDSTDFYGRFKLAWNNDKLFILAEINDDILSDMHSDPLDSYWADDAVEIFIDEDHSGGDQKNNYNAFSYHVSILNDVVDLGTDGAPHLYNNNLQVKRTNTGDYYTWEFAVNIYDSSFVLGSTNTPVTLKADKVMGFSIAYCDDDSSGTRETFMGSDPNSNGGDNHWINASEFATLTLLDTTSHPSDINKVSNNIFQIYPNPAKNYLSIVVDENITSNCAIYVYNQAGQILKSIAMYPENKDYSLYVGDLKSGFYFIKIQNKNYCLVQKLILN